MVEHRDYSWRRTLRRRLLLLSGGFLLWSLAIESRLVYLQVVAHEELVAEAVSQQSDTVKLGAKRGDILDRDGRRLAYNVDADSAWAVPGDVSNPVRTVDLLCGALRDCTDDEREAYVRRLRRLDDKGRLKKFAWLRRRMSTDQSARVAASNLKGVYFQTETGRYYPNAELGAHLLGWVGDENKGLAGVEQHYDWLIGSEPGKALIQVDNKNRPFSRLEKPSTAGATLVLTMDQYIQHVVERELAAGVKWSEAEGGSAIVLDPATGEILALANYPTFNPNDLRASASANRINLALQNVYEPGSTFKIVTAGAALEERLAMPSDLIDTNPGVIRFGTRVIDEAGGHNYGTLTFEDVIVKSSNVGAIMIGREVGADRLTSYVGRFGFGEKASKPDFGGESRGIVWKASDLTDSAVASVSMGYQVSVTALQMAAAFNAVANGGELLQPRLVKGVIRDGVYTAVPRTLVRRVVSSGTAAQLTSIMEGVVERGTAQVARVEGFTIAGKTGTAAKAIPGRGYSTTDFNVSFAGFVPSRNPAFTILVVIDSPHAVSPYGGTVAAPVFQKIAGAILRHRGVPPSINPPAPLLIRRHDGQQPAPAGLVEAPVVTVAGDNVESAAVFPNLVGLSARDAVRTMARLGLSPNLLGTGDVVSQRPAAGSALEPANTATLWLDRVPRGRR